MKGLLNAVWSWADFFKTYTGDANSAVNKALEWMTSGIWIAVGVAGLAGTIYAIYLGLQLAKADDQSKRDDVKKHLVTVIIAIAVTIALILFFLHILPAIVGAFSDLSPNSTTTPSTSGGTTSKTFIHF